MRLGRVHLGFYRLTSGSIASDMTHLWHLPCGCREACLLGLCLTLQGDQCYAQELKQLSRYYRARAHKPKLLKALTKSAKRRRTF